VSIEPIGSIDAGTTTMLALAPMYEVDPVERRSRAGEPTDLASLTAADRDLLTALYGPGILTNPEAAGPPQFLLDVIADRKSGQLPLGTELTSTYVQARFNAQVDLNGTVANPLTEKNLADAQEFFNDRVQGATIDLQA